MKATALALAARGLAVLPCHARDKIPACAHGWESATTDRNQIERWWRADPNYNVAIACGTPSGVFVLDIDSVDAEAELRKLEAEHGPLPRTVEAITPRPGRHIYFKLPAASVPNSKGRIAPDIEVKSTGTLVVVPPSIHPSGRKYSWSVDSASAFADAPAWLVTLATHGASGNGHAPTDWPAMFAADVPEGKRDETLTAFAGHLLRRYVDPRVALELLKAWNLVRCLPALPDKDVERIVRSITAREETRRSEGPKWPTTM